MEFPLVLTVCIVLLLKCLCVSIFICLSCFVIIKIIFIRHFEMMSSMHEFNIMKTVQGCSLGGGIASIFFELVIKVRMKKCSCSHNISNSSMRQINMFLEKFLSSCTLVDQIQKTKEVMDLLDFLDSSLLLFLP